MGSQAGISLVELLVAMAIGLILLAGMYQVFISSTTTYNYNDRLSRLQENGRFAIHVLGNELRGAGYLGCLQDVTEFKSVLGTWTPLGEFRTDLANSIQGYEATGSTGWVDSSGTLSKNALETRTGIVDPVWGSDVLVTRGVDQDAVIPLLQSMGNASVILDVPGGLSGILQEEGGEILLISDCQGATLFQSTQYIPASGKLQHNPGASHSPGNVNNDGGQNSLGHAYVAGAEIFLPRTTVYYIRQNAAEPPVPCLYRKVNGDAAEEVVEGVENMQVRYGVDTDGDRAVNTYVAAEAVSDWTQVLSVRIGLLIRTAEEVLRREIDAAKYDVDGDGVAEFGPVNDRRKRLVVSGTIGLRNRLR